MGKDRGSFESNGERSYSLCQESERQCLPVIDISLRLCFLKWIVILHSPDADHRKARMLITVKRNASSERKKKREVERTTF